MVRAGPLRPLIGAALIAVLAPLPACRRAARPPAFATRTFEALTTVITATLPADDRLDARLALVQRAFAQAAEELNEWRPGSPLAAVNAAAGGEPVRVPAALYDLVDRGVGLGELTGGAFDITWAALWGLWDFRAAEPRVPLEAEIAPRLAWIDYRRVELDSRARTLRLPLAGMRIGLGGIAKGWALQQAGRALRAAGVRGAVLSAGGQVLAIGGRGARPWHVGIRDPRGPPDEPFALLEVRDLSVSTSGDYERFFVRAGVRYHHILDPRTGHPARGLRSATVVCIDPVRADALSTAVMVLGLRRGLALVDRLAGVEALVVDEHGEVHRSRGMTRTLRRLRPPRGGPIGSGQASRQMLDRPVGDLHW